MQALATARVSTRGRACKLNARSSCLLACGARCRCGRVPRRHFAVRSHLAAPQRGAWGLACCRHLRLARAAAYR
eukprot:12468601-Alexandrium_andersonii.AAC.1